MTLLHLKGLFENLQMKEYVQDGVHEKGCNISDTKVDVLAVLSFPRYLRRHQATRSLKPDTAP